jgi:RNA polymerase sigma factor (sigma-70 family)
VLSEPLNLRDETAVTLAELILDPVAEDEYQRIIEQLVTEEVSALTDSLDDRERSILHDHYGIDGPPRTLREIGAGLGLSAERVRQIEERALDKLRSVVATPAGPAASEAAPLTRAPRGLG